MAKGSSLKGPCPHAAGAGVDRRRFLATASAGAAATAVVALPLVSGCQRPAPKAPLAVLPPGAMGLARFRQQCIRCFRCVAVCPVGAIAGDPRRHPDWLDLPVIRPQEQACVLCMKCTQACPSGALQPITDLADMTRRGLTMGVARIDEQRCIKISHQCTCRLCLKVSTDCICRLCYDVCPLRDQAITLTPKTLHPEIHPEACVGCGLCAQFCPERAIDIVRLVPAQAGKGG